MSIILNTATGHRSIGHNAAIAVGGTVALLGGALRMQDTSTPVASQQETA